MKIKCLIGLHNKRDKSEYLLSRTAVWITDIKQKIWCTDCGKVFFDSHMKWDDGEFIELNKDTWK